MTKVSVKNKETGKQWGGQFDTHKEAFDWVNAQVNKGIWGKEEDLQIEYEEFVNEYQRRKERDNILSKTDWLFISDVPIPTKHRKYYKEYRELLRKIDPRGNAPIEEFENFLRRTQPQEFLDGGDAKVILKKFYYYIRG